ncbi:hypothetical protein ACGFIX_34800 [Nocardia salmonicida]|uniref:YobI family P-loop NTPase n=1 Tax=Nocardia salmonicida TaxID=53431 RepID=UPI0037104FF7
MNDVEHSAGSQGASPGSAVAAQSAGTISQPAAPNIGRRQAALMSMAPQYDEARHKTYLDRLENALADPKNRNIALSGRYGTGKSSVLDKFQENHKASTLRLSVSTLAPDTEGVTLTNRIQKEVLKQLIYSAQPRTLRYSRFRRRSPLSVWRAIGESSALVGVLGALLALLGRLPSQMATGSGHSGVERAMVWVAVATLIVVVLAVLRIVTYNRFTVSNVSAAGAALTLSAPNHTYFDENIDEIVYFFDQEPTDIVIFEDLDRYNDPQIFQALRELNTLLNNTPKRLKKIQKHKKPLRFVYAMRDSLFEKIGEDTAAEIDDAAHAETVRANRTKFFELVIPIVPFISHRTAREHLHQLLQEADVTNIDRTLVELVAKYSTDKRLLLNMRNEFIVFAEQLLQSNKVAPGLSASHLFALIAYKNFHLEDFENISRRSSNLDTLYDYQRELVAISVADREQTKRDLLARNARPPALAPFGAQLGRRLNAIGKLGRDRNQRWTDWPLSFVVGSTSYNSDDVTTSAFWEAVIASPMVAIEAVQYAHSVHPVMTLNQDYLEELFPEVLQGRWEQRYTELMDEELQQLDRDIHDLRGADFRDLVNAENFTIPVPLPSENEIEIPTENLTFGELVHRNLKSELARDLVRQGYIDRNFTLYSAQFYGDFTGVDVATFIVQTVQTNSMDINYRFTSPGACANLIAETDQNFTRTLSAYNVQLLDYMLIRDLQRADEVIDHLTSNFGSEAERFLAAFFTSNGERTKLAARLSHKPWRDVFTYLVSNEGVPTDVRPALVDTALVAADPDGAYDLSSDVGDFVIAWYPEMPAFTEPHARHELDTIVRMLRRANVVLPRLAGVHEVLRELLVDANSYEMTAENLRTALNINGSATLDAVRANDAVYQHCLSSLGAYLDAVEADDETDYSTVTPQTLVEALEAAEADNETVERLTATASPDSSLRQLSDAPESTWPMLAAAKLFRPSLANLEEYRNVVGDIDESLGKLLLAAGEIRTDDGESPETESSDEEKKATVALAVLNAHDGIPRPEDRIQLVQSLGLGEPLPAAQIAPEANTLFALLLADGLVPDDADTFAHLRQGGWPAIKPAIIASHNVNEFLAPVLVDGMVAELLCDAETTNRIGPRILGKLADFLPTEDRAALAAAARFAIQSNTVMPVDQIHRVAKASEDATLTVELLQITAPSPSDIVAVLNELGSPYSYLITWENNEFEVPYDEAHRAVFKILADANRCQTKKKALKDILIVKRPQ